MLERATATDADTLKSDLRGIETHIHIFHC